MRPIHSRILSTASFATLAIAGFSSAAYAQPAQQDTTAAEVATPECSTLPEGPQRDECVQRNSETNPIEQSGDVSQVATPQQGAQGNTIVVTGSRIRRNEFNSPDPVSIINPELSLQEGTSTPPK